MTLPANVSRELEEYEAWIKKYRAREIGEVKMQKIRLQLGTYAQRQEGVQMQRIKFPGGHISSDQLTCLAEVAERYAGGFIHLTTREDAQLYYLQLEDCPQMMRDLASGGITTREACGNTVRNITACSRAGVSPTEPFDVEPYTQALFKFLVRHKFNQVMGRKFKIAFEGCGEDHAGMRFHDFGFKAETRQENGKIRRGFRTYVGGGLGGTPMLGFLYSEFLPEEDLLSFAAATVRLFDRHGERKNRMAARMKFLVKKMGWESFRQALDAERREVRLPASVNDYLKAARASAPAPVPQDVSAPEPSGIAYKDWRRDSVSDHKVPGFKSVSVRLKLGDLLSPQALALAGVARRFSHGQLRITIDQNLFLPWVSEKSLAALYGELSKIGLSDAGAETLEDVTTCPGADTCRLGITSAKGLGATIGQNVISGGLARYRELARGLKIKVSGCPNGCAQHGIANIGFQGAAMKKDDKTVPAHDLFIGGQTALDETAFGERIGKFPARNAPDVVEKLLELYSKERQDRESFNACMKRLGRDRIQKELAALAEVPAFDAAPEFYKDWGHENEKFALRTGIKGECAGAPVQEKNPVLEDAREKLAQAEAFLAHKEFANAQSEAYQAMGLAVRVPLYAALVDPFTPEQALWEFENIFARSGRIAKTWVDVCERAETLRGAEPREGAAKEILALAREILLESERLHREILKAQTPTV